VSWFRRKPCEVCPVREAAHEREREQYTAENLYMRGQVDKLQRLLAELTRPGSAGRADAPAPRAPRPAPVPAGSEAARAVLEAEEAKFVGLPPL
jgi:hypothetical protein